MAFLQTADGGWSCDIPTRCEDHDESPEAEEPDRAEEPPPDEAP